MSNGDASDEDFRPMIALRAVLDDPTITGKALLVAAALIRHADDAGRSYPGIDTLKKELGVSRSSILRGIAVLECAGRVLVTRESGCVNRYQFICDTGLSVTPVYSGNGTRLPVTPDPSTCDTRPVSPVDPKIPSKLPKKL
ncbi:MAG: helix-turn-helix domain-containing protein, partial [Acidobacteria bacterium]|nr:helix-turn-helix domain-containing protein [Acidobacteriota bacterium]